MSARIRIGPWGWALAFLLVVPNSILVFSSLQYVGHWESPVFDWWLLEEAYARIGSGEMYVWSTGHGADPPYVYRYSPLLPYLMAPFIAYGLEVWRLTHVALLFVLPHRVALVALLSGPFWFDVANGNYLTPILIAGWWAMRGSRLGMASLFILAALIPRPLMVPVVAWVLWRRPESRIIAGATAIACLGLTTATGELWNWLTALRLGTDMVGTGFDIGPSRFVGVAWWPVGIALAIWLTRRGYVGLAGLAISPYVLPYYLLIVVWDLPLSRTARISRDRASAESQVVPVSAPAAS